MSRSRMALRGRMCRHTRVLRRRRSPTARGQVSPKDAGAKRFVKAVSVAKIVEHQTELQRIATLNGDTREVFSPGYTASLEYVVETLRASGYNPKVTPFNFPIWKETQPPVLNMVSPTPKTYGPGTRRTATSRRSTSSRWPTRRRSSSPTRPCSRSARSMIRRPAARPAAARQGITPASPARSRSSSAARAPSSTKWSARAGRGRHWRDHLQRGQHARAPEPDLRRQPARRRRRRSPP